MSCARLGKLIGGCRFEPIYDTRPPTNVPPVEFLDSPMDTVRKMQAMTKHTFAGALCRTCGAIRDRGI